VQILSKEQTKVVASLRYKQAINEDMIYIPEGVFIMGSPDGPEDERPCIRST